MFSIRSLVRCGVAAVCAATALCAACGTLLESTDPDPPPDEASIDDRAAFVDGPSGDVLDASNADADADGGLSCADDRPFGKVTELTDFGDVTSARLAPDEATAFVSLFESPGDEDIYEGPFPKLSFVYARTMHTTDADTHPAPVTDPLRLFLEHGAPGARSVVLAKRAQLGQTFAIDSTPPLALDAGVQTREPFALGDGSIVYFTMEPGAFGGRDVYRASLSGAVWTTANVDGVSSALAEGHPVVTNDELAIFFSRAGLGGGQPAAVWMATRGNTSASFSGALPVDGLAGTNEAGGASDDRPTWVSADRCTLFFTSNRSGAYRAYRASRR